MSRPIDEIEALISASAWVNAVPNDRYDSSWETLRIDVRLTAPELSIYKNAKFVPQGTSLFFLLLIF
jgi:hypothetical protein